MMMNFMQFSETVKNEMAKKLGADFEVTVIAPLGNNGVVKKQLCIKKNSEALCPSISLQDYFEEYKEGLELQAVVDKLLACCRSDAKIPVYIQELASDPSYEKLKDKIMFKLISTCQNETLLKEIPSIPYLDLSIVFYLYLGAENDMKATAMINNRHLESWHISADELYQRALINMPKKLPPVLYGIESVLYKNEPENLLEKESVITADEEGMMEMFVLSNQNSMYGAAALLYPGVMKQCREKMGTDYIILPSSVEEVILVPVEDAVAPKELANMIQNINSSEVPVESILSNHAYRYCMEEERIVCA